MEDVCRFVRLGCGWVPFLTSQAFSLLRKRDKTLEKTSREPWEDLPPALPSATLPNSSETARAKQNSEDIRRIEVDDEDRLAFRVGVNFITLVLIGVGVYFLIRYLWG